MKKYRANGKLLLSGEYAVLDGSLALAFPTKLGQTLEVVTLETSTHPTLLWQANLVDGSNWFTALVDLKSLQLLEFSDEKLASKLIEIFRAIQQLKPEFFSSQNSNLICTTQLEFPQNWGLGSSSTLISLLAQWTEIDSFKLSDLTFKTSGYDIACAKVDTPIFYQIQADQREVKPTKFKPSFLNQLYLVHLNQKQDTQQSVPLHYRSIPKNPELIIQISTLTKAFVKAATLDEFESLIRQHETLLAQHMQRKRIKDLLFPEYKGEIKSLGAWGGDFVLVTESADFKSYFQAKGYKTILQLNEIIH